MLLDVNFEVGTDQDTANVLTQNRVSTAEARLPVEVNQQGVTVKKQSPSILMVISLYSPKDAYDANFLINYCGINLRDQNPAHSRHCAGRSLWRHRLRHARLDQTDRLAKLGLTPADVIGAIKEQNLQAPAGKVGGAPTPADQEFTKLSARPAGSLRRKNLKTSLSARRPPARWSESKISARAGSVLRITTRSAQRQARRRDGRLPPAGRQPAQSRETIYETMEHAKSLFPPDVDYKIVYDTTPAVEASIHEILKTFVEALILVTIVVFVFLQNIRATIIPLITIPFLLSARSSSSRCSVSRSTYLDVWTGAGDRHRG